MYFLLLIINSFNSKKYYYNSLKCISENTPS